MITDEIRLALDEKQDEILTGMPAPQDGKIGDIRTCVTHKGRFYQTMKAGIDSWWYSAPFTRTPSIHAMDDYLLKSGGRMLDDRRIYFRDTGLSIYSSVDGQLDIDADTELEITAPTVDINASTEVNISNNLTVGGDILLSNGNYVGISAAERLEFYTAGYAAFMGCNVGIGAFPNAAIKLDIVNATAGSSVITRLIHNDNTNVASHARIAAQTGGANGGDPLLLLTVGGVTDWSIGVDNSDSDSLKIGDSTAVGASTIITLLTGGNVGIGTTVPQTGFHNVGTTRLGDLATNYTQVEADGDVLFVGGGGLHFGEVYVVGNANASVLNSAAKVQFVHFDTDGVYNGNVTPAHGEDHITVGVEGMYLINAHLHIQNNAAQSHVISIDVYYNNGDTAVANVHCHANLSGGVTDVISMSISGIADLPAAATLEMWLNTDSGDDRSITVVDCTMTAVQIGGT